MKSISTINLPLPPIHEGQVSVTVENTVERQWLEQLWDHRKLFETLVVRATDG